MDEVRRWLPDPPPEVLGDETVVLVRPEPEDIGPLTGAINESLDELAAWMPWAQSPSTVASTTEFLEACRAKWAAGADFDYLIRHPRTGGIIGVCALHARLGPGALEIGYWVHTEHTGRGVATAAARALTDAALGPPRGHPHRDPLRPGQHPQRRCAGPPRLPAGRHRGPGDRHPGGHRPLHDLGPPPLTRSGPGSSLAGTGSSGPARRTRLVGLSS